MKKIYFFLLFVFIAGLTSAHDLNCPGNFSVNTDPGLCSATKTVNRPILEPMLLTELVGNPTYILTGATIGSGTYPNSGGAVITFAKGITTVTVTQNYRVWSWFFIWWSWYNGSATCSFNVTVNDTEKPTIACVANQTRPTDQGKCNYTVVGAEFNPVSFNDNCPGATISNNYNNTATLAAAVFPKGTTTVIWTVTDASGNASSCSFTVKVEDREKPTIACIANQTKPTDPGKCNYTVVGTEFNPVSFNDNCPGATISNNYNSTATLAAAVFPKGITTVIWTVTDASGNAASCSFTVKVEDRQKPVIGTCGKTYNVAMKYIGFCKWQGELPVEEINATIIDNCGSVGNGITVTYSRTIFNLPGCYIVSIVATDASGNITSCKINVHAYYSYLKSGDTESSSETGPLVESGLNYQVFPNPTTGHFAININNLNNPRVIAVIYNMAGSVVLQKDISTEGQIEFDLSDHVTGLYILRLNADKNETFHKIILRKE